MADGCNCSRAKSQPFYETVTSVHFFLAAYLSRIQDRACYMHRTIAPSYPPLPRRHYPTSPRPIYPCHTLVLHNRWMQAAHLYVRTGTSYREVPDGHHGGSTYCSTRVVVLLFVAGPTDCFFFFLRSTHALLLSLRPFTRTPPCPARYHPTPMT